MYKVDLTISKDIQKLSFGLLKDRHFFKNTNTTKYFRCPFNLAASQYIGGVAGWAQ